MGSLSQNHVLVNVILGRDRHQSHNYMELIHSEFLRFKSEACGALDRYYMRQYPSR